jgi:hypothetical protein
MSNNALQRPVIHHGRTALAINCVLAGAQMQRLPAAELNR